MKRYSLFMVVIGLCLATNGYADSLKSDIDKVMKKHGPGVDIVVSGKALPSSALKEWRAAEKALREARTSLNNARRALMVKAETADRIPDYIVRLSGRLDALSESLNMLARNSGEKYSDLYTKLKQLNLEVQTLKDMCLNLFKYLEQLAKLTMDHVENQETMSFGVSAFGSGDIAITEKEIMPIGGFGLGANWRKKNIGIDLMLGAGVSGAGKPALSWSFVSSFQFYLNDKLSIGPASVLSQDLGSMEGADRLAWSGGCKLKFTTPIFNLWTIPSVGVHGKRGHGQNSSPSYSPNIGIMVGIDYLIVK